MPEGTPVTLLLTADEETSKQGARAVAASDAARVLGLKGIVVAEPTGLAPVRGHRSHVEYTAVATGVQAHSSTGQGVNANWALIPFLAEMKAVFERLRQDPAFQDAAYDPPFSDFNLVIDNHGTAVNVTVAKASARIKFRRSRRIDYAPIEAAVRDAAARAGVTLTEKREGTPPELPEDHPLIRLAAGITGQAARTAPYGTDASELQEIAPCVVLGPGSIATAHTPHECVAVADLAAAVPVFRKVLASA
jgi:acetylornithine deacetylase